MILNAIFGSLAALSLALLLWQWLAARLFPLHKRARPTGFAPSVTLLKPLKGCDPGTEACLRSWFAQEYPGEIQLLLGIAEAEDPVCALAGKLIREFPARDAALLVSGEALGANAKVSTLAQLQKLARHEILVISDADVRVPPDFLANAVLPLRETDVGLVSCFYCLANPATVALEWEAIAINADFWSQVLQSRSLKPLDFALGAAMVTRGKCLEEIGGFKALADCLADDYQLGNRIARNGHRIELCPVAVECWDPPTTWAGVWKHQLRWARTIRVCQPAPYFFSILSNPTLWPLLWLTLAPASLPLTVFTAAACLRMLAALDLQRQMTRSLRHFPFFWLAPVKDLLQAALWLCAFGGNTVEWRGRRFRLRRDGTLAKI